MNNYKMSRFNVWVTRDSNEYLINTRTKGIIEFTRDERCLLENCLRKNKKVPFFEELIENGFLVLKETDELKELEFIYNHHFFQDSFISIILIPTMKCNFNCFYCFETDEKSMSWTNRELTILKQFFAQKMQNKKLHLSFFGGEPLLYWNEIKELLDYLNSIDIDYATSFVTNGYLLDDLGEKDYYLYNIESIQVTLDGWRNSHDMTRKLKNGMATYNKIMENIKYCVSLDCKLELVVRINLINTSIKDINHLMTEFSDYEKRKIRFYIRPIHETKKVTCNQLEHYDLNNYYEVLYNNGVNVYNVHNDVLFCEGDGGINRIHVMPDLSVWKCIADLEIKDAHIGQIKEDGTLDINHEKLMKFYNKNFFYSEKCKNCVYLPMCYGGCPLNSLNGISEKTCFYESDFNLLDYFQKL